MSTLANAAEPGFYLGGQAGWSRTHNADDNMLSGLFHYQSRHINNDGIAGRLFTGYQFDKNWAIELGYSKYSNTNERYTTQSYSGSSSITGKTTREQQALDLVGKGTLPLNYGFGVFAKAGGAWLQTKNHTAETDNLNNTTSQNTSQLKLLPTFGAGISYDITQNIPITLGWDRIQKTNNKTHGTDLFSMSIAYNFPSTSN